MKQHRVEPVRPAAHGCLADDGRGGDLAGAALEVDEVALHMLVDAAERGREHVVQRRLELRDSAAAHCDSFNHRNAELALQRLRIELQAVAPGKVDHVERDDGRQAKLDQLQTEAQMVVEVRRVDHDHQCIGLALALLLAEQHVPRDGFVGAGGFETVGAGQVDHLDGTSVGERQPARMALDGDAGIVADLLARAGERVEQRALAGIGIAGDGDERERVHLVIGVTPIAPAYLRRIATVMRPTRTAIGSRPKGPR